MPTYITNQLSTGLELSGLRVRDVDNKIFMLEPEANVLSRWLTVVEDNVRETDDVKFEHYDHEPLGWWTTVSTTSVNTSANTFSVADGGIFSADDGIKIINAAGAVEVAVVSSMATNVVTLLSRGSWESSRISFASGAWVLRLGSAYTEGDGAGTPKYVQYTNRFNMIQTFRTPVGWTDDQKNTKFYGGPIDKQRKRERAIDHTLEIERSLLWGEYCELDGTGANPRRTTRGLDKYITTNVFAIDGVLTEDAFRRDIMPSIFRYGSKEKLWLMDALTAAAVEGWASKYLRLDEKMTSTLGFEVSRFRSGFGRLMLAYHRLIENGYAGTSYIVDPANVRLCFRKNGRTKYKENIHANDYDGEKHEFITRCGMDVMLEKTHAKLTGVTG